MRIGVLGTGIVGTTLGSKLVELGHEVMLGARSAGGETACAWVEKAGRGASEGSFADAAGFGALVFNCTSGMHSLEALTAAGAGNPGAHDLFMCGNDASAKAQVRRLLESFGWPAARIVDLGDIVGARATETYICLWLGLFGALQTGDFNVAVVR